MPFTGTGKIEGGIGWGMWEGSGFEMPAKKPSKRRYLWANRLELRRELGLGLGIVSLLSPKLLADTFSWGENVRWGSKGL